GQVRVAGLEFLEQTHVLDGDDGLVGEGLQQLDLLVGERSHLAAPHADGADGGALTEDRDRENRPQGNGVAERMCVLAIQPGVLEVDEAALDDGAPRRRIASDGERIYRLERGDSRRVHALNGRELQLPGFGEEYDAVRGLAQSACALHDGVEDRPFVRWRAGDDSQNLAGRGLLLEGGGQVGVARFQFREQANVFDGDDGLVGEGLQQ